MSARLCTRAALITLQPVRRAASVQNTGPSSPWNCSRSCGIAAVAAQYPNRIALELPDRRISYRQLDDVANRLAQRLIDETEGVGKGADTDIQVCVPIMVEETEALLVAVEAALADQARLVGL